MPTTKAKAKQSQQLPDQLEMTMMFLPHWLNVRLESIAKGSNSTPQQIALQILTETLEDFTDE